MFSGKPGIHDDFTLAWHTPKCHRCSPLQGPKNHEPPGVAQKGHYLILDALRGVAALVVVLFHICEAYNPDHPLTQPINHGYLAVDFFFLLSGFVIAYAYDDRWQM